MHEEKNDYGLIYKPPKLFNEYNEAYTIKLKIPPCEEWEKSVKDHMSKGGWVNDRNDETTLGFSIEEGPHKWIRDYNKKSRTFVHYDGNMKINLRVRNER